MKPELIGYDSVKERDLYFMSLSDMTQFPENVFLDSQHFAVLLAMDGTTSDTESISRAARCLIRSGAAYVVCWGQDCERVHDIVDEIEISEMKEDDGSVIMTTWHADEPLSDALFHFTACSWPDDKYWDTCKAGLAISIGNPNWDAEIIEDLKKQDGRNRKTEV